MEKDEQMIDLISFESPSFKLMDALEATVIDLSGHNEECICLMRDLFDALTLNDYLDVLEYALGDLDEDEVDADIRVIGEELYSYIKEDA
jgi:hypothetical protein